MRTERRHHLCLRRSHRSHANPGDRPILGFSRLRQIFALLSAALIGIGGKQASFIDSSARAINFLFHQFQAPYGGIIGNGSSPRQEPI